MRGCIWVLGKKGIDVIELWKTGKKKTKTRGKKKKKTKSRCCIEYSVERKDEDL